MGVGLRRLFLVLLAWALLAGPVYAACPQSVCTADGGKLVDVGLFFSNWSSFSNLATLSVRDEFGKVVAFKTGKVPALNGVHFDFFPDADGFYSLDLNISGSKTDYSIVISYSSGGVPQTFSDANCLGSTCQKSVATFYLDVVNTPSFPFDDGKTLPVAVNGAGLVKTAFKFYDGEPCPGFLNYCWAGIRIRDTDSNDVLALMEGPWINFGFVFQDLEWYSDADGLYALEFLYDNNFVQYDASFSYTDSSDALLVYGESNEYVGNALGTGNATSYFFNVSGTPSQALIPGQSMPFKVAGNRPVSVGITPRKGHFCPQGSGVWCSVTFSVKDASGVPVVSVSGPWLGPAFPHTLEFVPAEYESYYVEVLYDGNWLLYDLNFSYADTSDVNHTVYDLFKYVGKNLSVGQAAKYFFDTVPVPCPPNGECAKPECVSVQYNGPPSSHIDIVFVGSGFPDLSSFADAVNYVADYDSDNAGLFSFKPFKEYREKFNVWRVDSLQTFPNPVVQTGTGSWLHDTNYYDVAQDLATNACLGVSENVPLIVSLMVDPVVRSHAIGNPVQGEAGGKAFISLGTQFLTNSGWPLKAPDITNLSAPNLGEGILAESKTDIARTLAHEFGHAFSALADEYDSENLGPPAGLAPNCTEDSTCSKWGFICSNCCIQSCGYKNWYRAYDNPPTLMRNPFTAASYRAVSEYKIETDINALVSLQAASVPADENSFVLTLHSNNGSLSLKDFNILDMKTNPPIVQPSNGYKVQVISFCNKIVSDQNVVFNDTAVASPFKDWFDANGNQIFKPTWEQTLSLQDFYHTLTLPYNPQAKEIRILDENYTLLLKVNVDRFMPAPGTGQRKAMVACKK